MSDLFYTIQVQNTFQVVLATDGNSSYVLFLYQDIQWGSATIGFNAGDGVRGYMAPEALTQNRIEGIRAFKVDGSEVLYFGEDLHIPVLYAFSLFIIVSSFARGICD